MHQVGRVGDLEIDQDLAFEEKNWAVQRAGWYLVGCVVLAALLGLLGPGPLSDARAGDPDRLSLAYERFGRMQSVTAWRVQVGPGAAGDTRFQLWVSAELLSHSSIESVLPTPERVIAQGDRIVFEFARQAPERPTGVVIHVRTESPGRMQGPLGLVGGDTLQLWRWVHP